MKKICRAGIATGTVVEIGRNEMAEVKSGWNAECCSVKAKFCCKWNDLVVSPVGNLSWSPTGSWSAEANPTLLPLSVLEFCGLLAD
ncbi:hypothetical protein [Marinobacterium arenosum]|uniref:hypothetical protein n=1 Tax=Marinobacterium arenosum TaxID=2862496 RepID=UPI001C96CC24|nr:hypothetical protein [Marinobacterium arenosum]MBY4675182.1 hypothetical protein [Marinobacterium arenosum]